MSTRAATFNVSPASIANDDPNPFTLSIAGLASFAEGPHGELYAVSIFGAIYRLVR